jgi:hypothetical protein
LAWLLEYGLLEKKDEAGMDTGVVRSDDDDVHDMPSRGIAFCINVIIHSGRS